MTKTANENEAGRGCATLKATIQSVKTGAVVQHYQTMQASAINTHILRSLKEVTVAPQQSLKVVIFIAAAFGIQRASEKYPMLSFNQKN